MFPAVGIERFWGVCAFWWGGVGCCLVGGALVCEGWGLVPLGWGLCWAALL